MTAFVKQHKVVALDYLATEEIDGRHRIEVDSRFDSGNIGSACFDRHNRAKVASGHQLVIKTEPDTDYKGLANLCRSWFYFRVTGFPKDAFILLSVGNLNLMASIVMPVQISIKNKKWLFALSLR